MEIGMLWYDDGPNAINDRVLRAAGYYTEKYGREPNLCFVNPGMLQTEEGNAEGIVIRKDKGIMPGHFWIGVDESQIKKNGNGKKLGNGNSKPKPKPKPKPEAKAPKKSEATAKTKVAKKSKTAAAKVAAAKPKLKATSGAAKPKPTRAKSKSAPSKPKKRKQVLLKKKTGARVKTGSTPKAKA